MSKRPHCDCQSHWLYPRRTPVTAPRHR